MSNTKKQVKITKLFRKRVTRPDLPEDCEELLDEILSLEQVLKDKQDQLFQLQRNSCRHKTSPLKKKSEPFIRTEKIILTNSVDTSKRNLELMLMLSGMEVQSYVENDHCSIVYHMQHNMEHQLKHGLMINMKNGINEVSKSSLPLGFNLSAVLDGFDNVMMPECLVAVRKALVAYYDRLDQFDHLKKMLKMEAELFKTLDGSHIEITFAAQKEHDVEEEQIGVTLMLDYRVYDIRPKQYSFVELDIPEEALDILKNQCVIFKKKPLHKAFKDALIHGNGAYIMVQQVNTEHVPQLRKRKPKPLHPNRQYNNDDTFHPEDCSESDDDVNYSN